MIRHLPNIITLGNLLAGCIGITLAFSQPNLFAASYLVLIAAVLDFLDGGIARLVNATSRIGKELDSLADLVSFGVLPAMILFQLIQQTENSGYLPFIALLIPLASALRLARFNIDNRQTLSFIGLPTPAAALFITGLPFFVKVSWLEPLLEMPFLLIGVAFLISLLMIVNLSIISLKFSPETSSQNPWRIVALLTGLAGVIWLGLAALPLAVLFYVLLSVIHFALRSAN